MPEETKDMTYEEVQKMDEVASILCNLCFEMFDAHKARLTEGIIKKIMNKHKVDRKEAINLFFSEYTFVKNVSGI